MILFMYGYLFVLGIELGSFYNVVGYGCRRNSQLCGQDHKCPTCKRTLTVTDLIPVLSYVFFKGRCRNCHSGISPLYPLIELATGLSRINGQ